MRVTINTRNHGQLSFFAPANGGYVRLESEGKPGTLGAQICEGGQFSGSTLSCGASEESLESVARRWWKQRRACNRKNDAPDLF
mgnify:CR=1 FL=1